MSWLSNLLKRDNVKAFLGLGLKILKLILGNAGDSLHRIANEEVIRAEQDGLTGEEKYMKAFQAIKNRLPEVRDSAINLAIELAVNALLTQKK